EARLGSPRGGATAATDQPSRRTPRITPRNGIRPMFRPHTVAYLASDQCNRPGARQQCGGAIGMGSGEKVLIVGASVRAAAFSALRAGLHPECADLFADADLQRRCPAVRVRGRYPHAFLEWIESAPSVPWLYTGGLENHPSLV